MRIDVAYTVDVQGAGAVQFCDQLLAGIHALRETARVGDETVVHLLYGNLPTETARRVMLLDTPEGHQRFRIILRPIQPGDLALMQQFTKNDPKAVVRTWSGICYARLFLYKFLPEVDKVLYLDADTLVRRSPAELFEMDMGGNPMCLSMGTLYEYGYNSGVILMDLKAMREEDGFEERLLEFMDKNSRKYHLPDQTTINEYFRGRITELGKEWNFPPEPGGHDPEMDRAAIWHFYAGTKPYKISRDDAGRALLAWNSQLGFAENSIRPEWMRGKGGEE